MNRNRQLVIADLYSVFTDPRIPLESLEHMQANAGRLIRRQFDNGRGGKCIFGLLSEPFTEEPQIDCRSALIAFYGGDELAPHYQPARAIVRLWDGRSGDPVVLERYGANVAPLTRRLVLRVLRKAIRRRKAELRRRRNAGWIRCLASSASGRTTESLYVCS